MEWFQLLTFSFQICVELSFEETLQKAFEAARMERAFWKWMLLHMKKKGPKKTKSEEKSKKWENF